MNPEKTVKEPSVLEALELAISTKARYTNPEEARAQNLESAKLKTTKKVKLRDITLPNPAQLQLSGGSSMTLGDTAFRQLTTLLGIPYQFNKKLAKWEEAEWFSLNKTLRGLWDRDVILHTKADNIIGFTDASLPLVDNDTFLSEIVSHVPKGYQIKEVCFSDMEMTLDVVDTTSDFSVGLLAGGGQDLFRLGFHFQNYPTGWGSPKAVSALERLSCTNGTYRAMRKFQVVCNKKNPMITNTVLSVFNHVFDVKSSINSTCQRLRDTPISLSEAEMVERILVTNSVTPEPKDFPVAYWKDRYQSEGKTFSWKSKAKCPMNAYEAYNLVTAMANNNPQTSRNLRVQGGNLFDRKWDLSDKDIPPVISWN